MTQKISIKHKFLLAIFLLMFLLPEILWSPVVNFYYELFQTNQKGGTIPLRYTFLQDSDNLNYLRTFLFVQFLGLLLFLSLICKYFFIKIKNKVLKYLLIMILSLLIFITGFAFYFIMVTNSIDVM